MKKIFLLATLILTVALSAWSASPTPIAAYNCPKVVATAPVPGAKNYGCYDGSNFWTGDGTNKLYKISSDGKVLKTYDGLGAILYMAYDGTYLWVGDFDQNASLKKFNPATGAVVNTYTLNPGGTGKAGGIQGLVWDGKYLWAALAGLNEVVAFNPATAAFSMTVTGQINVNGIVKTTNAGQEYILAACDGFWSKINASDGSYKTYKDTPYSYRIASDGASVYTASFSSAPPEVQQFSLSNGKLLNNWAASADINAIALDNKGNVWTAANGQILTVLDGKTGKIICQSTGTGLTDVEFDGKYMWAINPETSSVYKLEYGK